MDMLVRANLEKALEVRIDKDNFLNSIDVGSFFHTDYFKDKNNTSLRSTMFENEKEFKKYLELIILENKIWRRNISSKTIDIIETLEKAGANNLGLSMYMCDYRQSMPLTIEKVKAYIKIVEIWIKATKLGIKKFQTLVNNTSNRNIKNMYINKIIELNKMIKKVSIAKNYFQAAILMMKDFNEFYHHHYTMFIEYQDYSFDSKTCQKFLVKETISKINKFYPNLEIGVVYLLSLSINASTKWLIKKYGVKSLIFN